MKINKQPLYYRSDSLRVQVLRKTVPKSYFKQKAKLFRTVTRDVAMQLLNDFKRCSKLGQKPKNEPDTPKKGEPHRFTNYKMIAINLVKKISGKGSESPKRAIFRGEKTTVVDEKTGKVAKLLYL